MLGSKPLKRPRLTLLVQTPYAWRDGTYVIVEDENEDGVEEGILSINIIADKTMRSEMFFEIRAMGRELPFGLFIDMAHKLEFHSEVISTVPGLKSGPFQVRAEPSSRGNYLEAEMEKQWIRPGESLRTIAAYLCLVLGLQPKKVLLWRMDIARVEVKRGTSVPFVAMAKMMIDDRSHIDSLTLELQAIRASCPDLT